MHIVQCCWCGKKVEEGQLHAVEVPIRMYKRPEMDVYETTETQLRCDVCQFCVGPYRLLFEMVDGPTYTHENRPPFWHNDVPYNSVYWLTASGERWTPSESYDPDAPQADRLDHEHMALDTFPLIEDFEIVLERMHIIYEKVETISDAFVWLYSPSRGYLTHMLLHNSQKDLCKPDFTIPHGDFQHPHDDIDQGYDILLFEDELFVYIITGNWEIKDSDDTWFKVEKHRYYQEWERAIARCRALPTLER